MTFLSRLLSRRVSLNPTTVRERQRLDNTMPGQVGALAASRHGLFV